MTAHQSTGVAVIREWREGETRPIPPLKRYTQLVPPPVPLPATEANPTPILPVPPAHP